MILFHYHEWANERPARTLWVMLGELIGFSVPAIMLFPHGVPEQACNNLMAVLACLVACRVVIKFVTIGRSIGTVIRAGLGFLAAVIILTQLPSLSAGAAVIWAGISGTLLLAAAYSVTSFAKGRLKDQTGIRTQELVASINVELAAAGKEFS